MLRLLGAAGMGGVIAAACSTTTTSQPAQTSPYLAGASSYPGNPAGSLTGVASWYGPGFNGKRTANGEVYNQEDLTAASPSLPLGSRVMVTNLDNGRSVEVRVNDRGPFVGGRKIDLSHRAAEVLGVIDPGTAHVQIDVLGAGAAAALAASDSYAIQFGAFSDPENAKDLRLRLASQFTDVRIEELDSGLRHYYRVRMGRFPNRDQAEQRAEQTAALGFPVIIVRQ